MKKKVTLLWAVHFHQPLGNFGEIFDKYAAEACAPFLAALEEQPSVKVSLHFSGVLLSYLKEKQGAVFERLGRLVSRGQVELLGGGFYEPIFSLIPREDAEAQLGKMSDWIEAEFGAAPHGAWLPESVWEPHFVEPLFRSGYRYTLLEDSLFEAAGWKRAQLFRAFRTSHLNRQILVFPYNRLWSRQIPLEGMREIKAAFTQLANRPERQIVTLAQNGDRYGFLPSLRQAVYEGGALREWLRYLAEDSGIETARLGDVAPVGPSWPLALLPGGAAEDLEPCSMPAPVQKDYEAARSELSRRYDNDRFVGFFRGGAWLSFLAKYPEARRMHAKLLWLRDRVEELPHGHARDAAREALLAAQDHSVYWHARQGGVHANYLRDAVYQRLIEAEIQLHSRDASHAPRLLQTDYDGDEQDEVFLHADLAGLLVAPHYGGSVGEFSFWPTRFNVGNTFSRRAEAYHNGNPAPVQDWYERRIFQDHFVAPYTQRENFARNDFIEYGDFADQPYEIVKTATEKQACSVTLERQGALYVHGDRRPLTCRKTLWLENPGRLTVDYVLLNTGTLPTDVLFVPEVNYTCLSGDGPERFFQLEGGEEEPCSRELGMDKVSGWRIVDRTRRLEWRWKISPEARLWHHPVYTLTPAAPEMEPHYQGSAIQIVWPLQLAAGGEARFRIVCEMAELQG
ncbi:MAG: DUF1926 domain-containing protein [Verrucomicrobium sp.]|nr:DUF1926 domain-containing protein [Verrucomicrobium sp.]